MIESGISREARVHIGEGQYDGPTDTAGFMGISVTATGKESIDNAAKLLSGIEGGLERAVRSAMNRAVARLRRANVEAVRERYAISAANIRAEENVQVSYTYDNGVQAFVHFSGARIPLYRFDGASPAQPTPDTSALVAVMSGEEHWRLMHPGIAAAGHVLKSTSPYTFSHAFVAKMPNGHTGIYERTGGMTSGGKDEIEELFGPSVPGMLANEEVEKVLADDVMGAFGKDLDHNVLAILNGYMR